MKAYFQKLQLRYRYSVILLKELVKTDYKLRYQGSVLGYMWSLLKPLALFTILYLVFVRFLKFGTGFDHYPVYLLLGIVMWSYFIEVTTGGMQAIVSRGDLLRKINFPKYVIVLSGSFSALINLFFNLVVVAVFMLINGVDIRLSILFLPLILLQLFIFSLAVAFFLSAAFVKYRDLSHIWDVIMQGLFYATPILYLLSQVPEKYAKIQILNPIAQMIQDARYVAVNPTTQTIGSLWGNYGRLITVGFTLLAVIISANYFRKKSKFFAEDI